MVLLGYLAFLDPPKDSASKALAALSEHGVRVKVLTGDNDAVTRSVCRQVGLPGKHILLGAEIEAMDDEALKAAVEKADIFVKLSPRQKARIVTHPARQRTCGGLYGRWHQRCPGHETLT